MSARRGSQTQLPARRLLLPAQLPNGTSTTSSVSSSASMAHQPPQVTVRGRRRNIDKACKSCRERKTRCDGAEPACSGCVKHRKECVYPADDGRSLKRKTARIQERLEAHEELYRVLQSKDAATAGSILHHIRDGHDLDSTLSYLRQGDLLTQLAATPETWTRFVFPYLKDMPSVLKQPENPYFHSDLCLGIEDILHQPSRDEGGLAAQYRIPYHAARLVEERIDQADVSLWTQVTDDSDLVRELLRIYFLYEYPPFAFFHKDFFLDDLVAGHGDHCSSLLVNSVLALACHAYSKAPFRNEFWNPKSLQYSFAAEARRLHELDFGIPSLTSVQAAVITSIRCVLDGIERVAWSYVQQALALMEDLPSSHDLPDARSDQMRVAKGFTFWAVFIWQSHFCFHYFKTPLMKQPPPFVLPAPSGSDNSFYPELWVQYPTSKTPIPLHIGDSFKAQTELRLLMNDIALVAFPHGRKPQKLSLQRTQAFFSQLEQWYKRLPTSLSVKTAVLPHQLLLHMHYFNILVLLFTPVVGEPDSMPYKRILEALVSDAKIRFETVFRLYYLRHGFEFWNSLLLHFEVVLGYSALEALSADDGPSDGTTDAVRSTLALAIKGLHEQQRYSHIGSTIYRLICSQMHGKNSRLLRDYGTIADDNDDVVAQRELHVDSQYPMSIKSIAEDPEKYQIGNLARAYRDMSLQESARQPDP